MKKFKKLASILLAAAMVLAMTVPAMAAITANDLSGHTFKAYQIFKGEKDDRGRLGNIDWGNGINKVTFIEALKTANILTGEPADKEQFTAYEVSEAIAKATDRAKEIAKIAEDCLTTEAINLEVEVAGDKLTVKTELPDGYYIIKDETPGNNDVDDVFNLSLLQVTGKDDIDITVKTDIPSVEKDVQDNDVSVGDSTFASVEGVADKNNNIEKWGETADYNIGETVPFRLTATIPASVDMEQYESYKVVFHDTMNAGLTFDEIVSVKINDEPISDASKYALAGVEKGAKGKQEWTITIEDVKQLGVDITKDIKIEVIYNAVLNTDAVIGGKLNTTQNSNDVYLEYSNQPYGEGTGKTKNDTVYVFTFDIPGTKQDGEENPLSGASFALYRNEITGDGGTVTSREYAKLEGSKVVDWVTVEPDADGKFGHEYLVSKGVGEVTSAEDTGKFTFEGLDAGEYMLQETVTPKGYNTAKDEKVTITVTEQKENIGTGATAAVANDPANLVIVNNQGAELPETGGIGTTIFYVLGSILVLGAVIVLVTKKRMSAE